MPMTATVAAARLAKKRREAFGFSALGLIWLVPGVLAWLYAPDFWTDLDPITVRLAVVFAFAMTPFIVAAWLKTRLDANST